MIKGFRDFLMRGNIVDLAVAVVIGTAFGKVVEVFAKDFIGGIIGAIGGTPNFDGVGFSAGKGEIVIGSTITALINFVIVAAAVYFFVVMPMQKIMARTRKPADEAPAATPEDIALLTEIRDLLRTRAL